MSLGAGVEGETIAVLAGVVAHSGALGFWSVVLAAALGSVVADQVWFAWRRGLSSPKADLREWPAMRSGESRSRSGGVT